MYKTKDLHLASTLLTIGFRMVDVEIKYTKDKPEALFIFDDSDKEALKVARSGFWNDTIRVSARQLLSNQKILKGRIHEEIGQKS